MTSGHSRDLPNPPVYLRSALHIPPFFGSNHPYTKWMLNMIRGNANHRLTIMVKERPELFQQYYQIADQPDAISSTYYDTLPIFHARCVLYLTPLGLAIYLKREKAIELLLKSGVNTAHQSCYATEVFTRGNRRADILEILPACVALRREFLEAIPLLCNTGKMDDITLDSQQQKTLQIQESLTLRYENRDCNKIFRYRDLLHYATETMQRRPNFPLCRLMDTLLADCQDFQNIDEEQFSGKVPEPISLFRRLARIAYYQDSDLRLSLQLISSLDSLIKNRCCVWKGQNPPADVLDSDYINNRVAQRDAVDTDQDASLFLLCGHYQRIREKTRNGPLDHMGQLFFHFLSYTRWRLLFLKIDHEQLQLLFKDINENISVGNGTLNAIQKHLQTILALERDREMVVTSDARLRREKGRTVRSTCHITEMKPTANPLLATAPQSRNKFVYISNKMIEPPGIQSEMNGSLFSYRPNSSTSDDTVSNSMDHSTISNSSKPARPQPNNQQEKEVRNQVMVDFAQENGKINENSEILEVEDDDLAALESDWRELEQNGRGDSSQGFEATLIDFIHKETSPKKHSSKNTKQKKTKSNTGPKEGGDVMNDRHLQKKSHHIQESDNERSLPSYLKEDTIVGSNASNNFQTDDEMHHTGCESDTIYEDNVNRVDMDAYEDRVLHEMLEEFVAATIAIRSSPSRRRQGSRSAHQPIYGARKYNHNQRSQ